MDDDDLLRETLRDMLSEVGYEVKFTKDSAEAIGQYSEAGESEQPFDAVILDLTIAGDIGGKEVVRKLLEMDPDVKAIVSSGYSTNPVMSKFREYGFSAAVPKPYSVEELEKSLHSIAGKK